MKDMKKDEALVSVTESSFLDADILSGGDDEAEAAPAELPPAPGMNLVDGT